ncbi:polysaccharide biosynthesis protein [Firmicutes bacterium CAG:822]|nr:polysaccharide biosynthesis protein [Firmicutes bacterium CAG:822]
MKRTGFLAGAAISVIGIVICKVIGLVYVIPFYAIIGTQGGALYSYAYSIYNVFLNLATSGIPVAMSKVVSEYNEMKFYNTKERVFKIGLKVISILCVISFLVLFIFAPEVANMIIGGVEGGNSTEDVAMVIRVISTAVLVVPFLSVSKGYLQGHKIMQVSSIADILEQLARVIVILAGSFLTLKVFNLSLNTAVGVAVFGATVGALVAYFYVFLKIKKAKDLKRHEKATLAEKKITDKDLIRKIIFYAMPFVVISLLQSVYVLVDVFTVVKGLVGLGYTTAISENVVSVIQTWGSKLNMIVMSISTGIITSLIPTIASAWAVKNIKEVNGKITQALQSLFLVVIPLSVGISFMSQAVWTVFYGYDELNSSIFKLLILSQIPLSICSVMVNTNQTMNNTKATVTALGGSLIFKILLNVPFMHLFSFLGLESYYATITLNILIDTTASIYLLRKVKKETNINYLQTIRTLIKVVMCTLIMILGLSIMNLFIPSYSVSRFGSILYIILYGIVGIAIYFFVAYKSNTISDIVGKDFVNKILSKFKGLKKLKKTA